MEIFERICILIFLCFLWSSARAQNLDTLMSQAKIYLIQKEYDSARTRYFEAIPIAEQKNDYGNLAIIHNNIGVSFKSNPAAKITHFDQAIFYHTKNGDQKSAAGVQYNMGLVLKKRGLNEEAIQEFSSALKIFLELKDTINMGRTLDVIGNLYLSLDDFENAEYYHLKALDRFILSNSQSGISRVWHNMAELCIEQYDLQEARSYLERSKKLKQKLDLSTISTDMLMGEILVKERQWDSAYYYYSKALNERVEKGYKQDFPSTYYHLGDFYLQKGDLEQSAEFFNLAGDWADSLEQNRLQIDILEKQVELDKLLGHYESSGIRYEKLMHLKDMVLGESAKISAAHFSARHDLFQKEIQIDAQKKQIGMQKSENRSLSKKYNLSLIIIGVFILMLLVILYLTIRLRRKNKLLNDQNETIQHLHSELRHRTKNYYQMLKGILWYDLDRESNPGTKELIKRYISRVESMAQIQHYLIADNKKEESVQLDTYLGDLVDQVDIALNRSEPKVTLNKQLESVLLDYNSAAYLGIALNELLQNAFKHSFFDIQNPTIEIQLHGKDGRIHLIVEDNGVGMEKVNQFKNQSEGIRLISVLTERIEGKLSYGAQKGSGVRVELTIPIPV